jgi:hypothetical protein
MHARSVSASAVFKEVVMDVADSEEYDAEENRDGMGFGHL